MSADRHGDGDGAATAPSGQTAPVLELRGVSKWFGQVHALEDVGLTVYPGEVHGLLGDNGAGKSTALKIAAGVIQPDRGAVLIDGREERLLSPLHARDLGIETAFQDLALADARSCTANVFMGREKKKAGVLGLLGVLDRKAMHEHTAREFRELGITVRNPKQEVRVLSGGQRQGVAIARAAMWARHLVLLDEPTAALGVRQRTAVTTLIEQLRERGLGVLLISHDVPEVLRIADRITILRLGRAITTVATDGIDVPFVVARMVGEE